MAKTKSKELLRPVDFVRASPLFHEFALTQLDHEFEDVTINVYNAGSPREARLRLAKWLRWMQSRSGK